jgi:hypothetical protein
MGLFGSSVLPADPAAAVEVPLPIVMATVQPVKGTVGDGDERENLSATRFPLIGIAYPMGVRTMATLTFGSFLDQRWAAESQKVLDLAGEDVLVTDRFSSDGGVSALRVGVARAVTDRVGAALTVGVYTGELNRTFTHQFDSLSVGADVSDFVTRGRWQLRGPTVTAGGVLDPIELGRVAGSVTWSGDLRAEPQDDTEGGTLDFSLPLEYRVGASGALTPRLSLTAGVTYADWSDTGKDVAQDVEARASWSIGGGMEWQGPAWIGRRFPVRAGYRHRSLPFRFGDDEPSESIVAMGLALNFSQVEDIPLARIDIAVEKGDRSAGALNESFWRTTVSLRLSSR